MISAMPTNLPSGFQHYFLGKRGAVFTLALLVFLNTARVVMINNAVQNMTIVRPTIVIRLDDIQDFAFKESQLFLLNGSIQNNIPVSLAVIAGAFGSDEEIVQAVKLAINSGSTVAVHGWEHEDLSKLTFREQLALLFRAKMKIQETLNHKTRTLVPPMFSYNEATLEAMREEGYDIISTLKDFDEPALVLGVMSLPATIELSDYSNGLWRLKNSETIKAEILFSIQRFGFAIILTHPQEFLTNGKLNHTKALFYTDMLVTLKEEYYIRTLEELACTYS